MSTKRYIKNKNSEAEKKVINPNKELFLDLPAKKYDILYVDPPWDYGGKLQYDKSSFEKNNENFDKDIFISSASFHYPTIKFKDLAKLDIQSISKDDALLFMWTTGPHMEIAIKLGNEWGFKYKTMAFVWEKQNHNPGHYTISSTEFCLVFKKGKIPRPRGIRNARQFISKKRTRHSEKPIEVSEMIHKMFPKQDKIELFARRKSDKWDYWGLDI